MAGTDEELGTRRVTIVVCDGAGDVLGELETFVAEMPWWQETEPLQKRHPWLTTLRLLEARPDPGGFMGGEVTYLAEMTGEPPDGCRLLPSPVELTDDPLRMPWARPRGPTADLEWVDLVAGVCGAAVQHRTWNLSSIWEMPVRAGQAWLKCTPPFFEHEAAVIRLLGASFPRAVPEVIASEGHRILLRELPGRDGLHASLEERRGLIDALVTMQASTIRREPELLAAGVPDSRWPALARRLGDVVERRAPADTALTRLLEDYVTTTAEIDACGLPPVLVHGDAHGGNARIGTGEPIWFDWGDSTLGHPLLDLAVLERDDPGEASQLEAHWLAAWAAAVPGSEPARAWSLLRPLALLRPAAVYQGFLDNIERSEQIYHRDDVEPALSAAAAATRPTAG